jgi:mannitol/fructose-specific phosphotransferase system IIA component (Ntr-type)
MPDLPLPFPRLAASFKKYHSPLAIITADTVTFNLKGKTKETIINELLDILTIQGKLSNRDMALKDLLDREETMSTAIPKQPLSRS